MAGGGAAPILAPRTFSFGTSSRMMAMPSLVTLTCTARAGAAAADGVEAGGVDFGEAAGAGAAVAAGAVAADDAARVAAMGAAAAALAMWALRRATAAARPAIRMAMVTISPMG